MNKSLMFRICKIAIILGLFTLSALYLPAFLNEKFGLSISFFKAFIISLLAVGIIASWLRLDADITSTHTDLTFLEKAVKFFSRKEHG